MAWSHALAQPIQAPSRRIAPSATFGPAESTSSGCDSVSSKFISEEGAASGGESCLRGLTDVCRGVACAFSIDTAPYLDTTLYLDVSGVSLKSW